MIDLNAEMDSAADLVTPKMLLDAGLDWETTMLAGGIGLVRAQTFADGTYEPVDNGRLMWCLPCFHGPVSPEYLSDIVAWHHADPCRWWRRTLHANVLGFTNIQRCRQSVWDFGGIEPASPSMLVLHQTPKEYALAGFDGAVVLDWKHGAGELEGIKDIGCQNVLFAEQVDRKLKSNRAPLPAVLVNDAAGMEAA